MATDGTDQPEDDDDLPQPHATSDQTSGSEGGEKLDEEKHDEIDNIPGNQLMGQSEVLDVTKDGQITVLRKNQKKVFGSFQREMVKSSDFKKSKAKKRQVQDSVVSSITSKR